MGTQIQNDQILQTIPRYIVKVARTISDQSMPTSWTAISWDTEIFDTVSGWSAGSPTIITTPAGFSYASVKVYVCWNNSDTGERLVVLKKNSTVINIATMQASNESGNSIDSGFISVSENDTFSVEVYPSTAMNLNGDGWGGGSYLEVIFYTG